MRLLEGREMWKFYFYTQWQYSKVEKWLQTMEFSGLRLEKICFFWFFKFKTTVPKKVQYLYTQIFPKDFDESHYKILQKIKGEYSGNKIGGNSIFTPDVYRICNTAVDLKNIRMFWQQYLKRVFLLKMLISSLFFLPTILLLVFGFIKKLDLGEGIMIGVASISFIVFFYYLIGLILLTKKENK